MRRKAENETITQQRSLKVNLPDIMLPQKSHPGVRGSARLLSRVPLAHFGARLRRPPKASGPGRERRVLCRRDGDFFKAAKAAGIGQRRRGLGGAGRGGPWACSREQYLPASNWASLRPRREGSCRSSGLGPRREEDLKAGPLPPRSHPGPPGDPAGSGWPWRLLLGDTRVQVGSASRAPVLPALRLLPYPRPPPLPCASSHYLIRSR